MLIMVFRKFTKIHQACRFFPADFPRSDPRNLRSALVGGRVGPLMLRMLALFEHGERCFSGIVRSLKVQFECGENYVVETATWMSWMSYSRGWWTGGIGTVGRCS